MHIRVDFGADRRQAQEAHHDIRAYVSKEVSQDVAEAIRIIYGGSVTGASCGELGKVLVLMGFTLSYS